MSFYPGTVRSNSLNVEFKVLGEIPEFVGVLVQTNYSVSKWQEQQQKTLEIWQQELKTNYSIKPPDMSPPSVDFNAEAKWIPFKTNLIIDLGPGDGSRQVSFGYRYKGQTRCDRWEGSGVDVQSLVPFITVTYPRQTEISQPTILLKGYSSDPVRNIRYDVINQNSEITSSNEQGFVNDQYYDQTLARYTTNYFTCYDVPLSPGTNIIVLRCDDYIGNSISTNFTYVLNLKEKKTSPIISVDWPKPEMRVTVGNLTVRGKLDDGTESIVGEISAVGQTNTIKGAVEWSYHIDGAGYFWIKNVPILQGPNALKLTATDAAGNSISTNLVLEGTEGPTITMDPVVPADKLWQPYINITGEVSPANNNVWVNGVKAVVNPDGTWLAKNVPVLSPNVGTACFDLTSVPPNEATNTSGPGELTFAQTSIGTNAITLNQSSPVCGVFQLHVNNASKRNFVLLASTNLADWYPIVTNSNPDTSFDYTDTNVNNYKCRFFRVVPSQ